MFARISSAIAGVFALLGKSLSQAFVSVVAAVCVALITPHVSIDSIKAAVGMAPPAQQTPQAKLPPAPQPETPQSAAAIQPTPAAPAAANAVKRKPAVEEPAPRSAAVREAKPARPAAPAVEDAAKAEVPSPALAAAAAAIAARQAEPLPAPVMPRRSTPEAIPTPGNQTPQADATATTPRAQKPIVHPPKPAADDGLYEWVEETRPSIAGQALGKVTGTAAAIIGTVIPGVAAQHAPPTPDVPAQRSLRTTAGGQQPPRPPGYIGVTP